MTRNVRLIARLDIKGPNLIIGAGCSLGRNVVLDGRAGPIVTHDGVEIRDFARFYAKDINIGSDLTVAEGCVRL